MSMDDEHKSREELIAELAGLRQQIETLSRRLAQSARTSADTQEQIYSILAALPDVIFILNTSGRYLHIFTGESNLLAAPSRDLIGKTVHEALPPEAARGIQQIIDKTLATQKTQKLEYQLEVGQGTSWFDGTIVPVALDGQDCVMWVARDITTRKLAEQEIQKARDAALESDRLKLEFVANVSHELRTPLNGIVGFSEILDTTQLDEAQKECVTHIKTCTSSLLAMINDILDFSRSESGHLPLDVQPFELRDVVHRVIDIFRTRNRSIRFSSELDPVLPPVLGGDPDRIRQILMNLVGNAAKFTRHGEVTVRVARESRALETLRVRFEVTDTGIGIPENSLALIFEPFVQGDGAANRKYEGTGLGLAIVKRLVALMNGELGVTSSLGKGSTFSFTIPLRELSPEAFASPEPDRTAQPDTGQDSAGNTVLIVEDNPIGQRVAIRLIRLLGYHADIATNGLEAIEAVNDKHYDIILMDCQMPLVDGYEATRRIRQAETSGRRVPIIALTANAMPGDRETCLAAGMDDYLSKPLLKPELAAMLRKWMHP